MTDPLRQGTFLPMDTITLDTPEQINMWVLLSRRHQVQLHLKGYKVRNLVKWGKANLQEFSPTPIRTAKDMVVPIEYLISQAGGDVDYKLVNLHLMERVREDVFQDLGILDSPAEIAEGSYLAQLHNAGRLEVVLTLEGVRSPNGNLFTAY